MSRTGAASFGSGDPITRQHRTTAAVLVSRMDSERLYATEGSIAYISKEPRTELWIGSLASRELRARFQS
jgi:hypothetical protein